MKYTEVYNLLYKTAQTIDGPIVSRREPQTRATTPEQIIQPRLPNQGDQALEAMNQNAVNTIIANNYDIPAEPVSTGRVKYFNGVVNGKRVFAANNNDNMPLEPQLNAAANGQGRNIPIRKSK